jgi:hypothetical protein
MERVATALRNRLDSDSPDGIAPARPPVRRVFTGLSANIVDEYSGRLYLSHLSAYSDGTESGCRCTRFQRF